VVPVGHDNLATSAVPRAAKVVPANFATGIVTSLTAARFPFWAGAAVGIRGRAFVEGES
jgi:hypothetical protein